MLNGDHFNNDEAKGGGGFNLSTEDIVVVLMRKTSKSSTGSWKLSTQCFFNSSRQ